MIPTSSLAAPAGGWTADDLDALPDDGPRDELVDGVLLVSAAPTEDHQITLTVLELRHGTYVMTAVVTGDEAHDAVRPYAVRVVPGDLLR